MATKVFWIQLENHAWDMNPHHINRMTGETVFSSVPKDLTSPETLVTRTGVPMYEPVEGEALILRRYTENWAAPDDRKVNPWDLNEPDPTDSGTMGTIPGATIECNVGDDVIVYFRNKDSRPGLSVLERSHSLHPHGIVFAPEFDGAYPLSPPDLAQSIAGPPGPDETALWSDATLDIDGFKKGDRVPPGGTFIYRWNTFGWPATAGVWLYHDHAPCDIDNVALGAIGVMVIHNAADPDDVLEQDLPPGGYNGRLTRWCRQVLATDELKIALADLSVVPRPILDEIGAGLQLEEAAAQPAEEEEAAQPAEEEETAEHAQPAAARLLLFENNPVEVLIDRGIITAFFRRCYVEPPQQALYLQLYHEMPTEDGLNVMAINGRRFMGNTPTLLGGVDTKMRFGLVAMNSVAFHTLHLHGHRWVIAGPSGGNVGGDVPPPGTGVQVSPLDQGVSQFEDTRIFGPANSFSFTINQGSFMGPPLGGTAKGEWHMHCHVLDHMMGPQGGMMGSLLIVEGGQVVTTLPRGRECPPDEADGIVDHIDVEDFFFDPPSIVVPSGTVVTFHFHAAGHTVENVSTTGAAVAFDIDNGGGPFDPVPAGDSEPVTITGGPGDQISYRCGIHNTMTGTITIS